MPETNFALTAFTLLNNSAIFQYLIDAIKTLNAMVAHVSLFNRVKVNITYQFLQISIFLADNRLACPVKSKCHNLIMWKDRELGQSSARYLKTMII